jgi:hypothetical protein
MKTLLGFGLVAVILLVAGDAFRRASNIEDALAAAQEQLATTTHVSAPVDQRVDDSIALVQRVPWLGARITRAVKRERAEAAYWQGDYGALSPSAGEAAATTEDDPALLLLTADAGYRSAERANRTPQTLARSLDDVLKAYTAVLKADPTNKDAAFNYEYVVQLRAALTANRGAAVPALRRQNMQGEPGEPPDRKGNGDFNVIVPLRPEERQDQTEPGVGAGTQRKG